MSLIAHRAGSSSTGSGFPPHRIKTGETVTVPDARQMAVFAGLEIDGTGALALDGDAELVLVP